MTMITLMNVQFLLTLASYLSLIIPFIQDDETSVDQELPIDSADNDEEKVSISVLAIALLYGI